MIERYGSGIQRILNICKSYGIIQSVFEEIFNGIIAINGITLYKSAMGYDAVKLEIIEWLTKLEDPDTIQYLKNVKDSASGNHDWWEDLSEEQRKGIERGLKDIDEGRTVPHAVVKNKYGL